MNFIPFWIQIRGIPFQFLNREVISHVGRALGNLLDVDYEAEAAARVEYVRVLVNWDVSLPLRFQRHFQFQAGVNTLLRFRYERLRGFCEVCGLMTHDSGACILQNGGEEQRPEGDDDDELPQARVHNQGVVIREIIEGEEREAYDLNGAEGDDIEEEEEELDDIDPNHDALANIEGIPEEVEHYSMFNAERETSEVFNPIPIYEGATGDIPGSPSYRRYSAAIHPRLELFEGGQVAPDSFMTNDRGKRKREDEMTTSEVIESSKVVIREIGEGSGSSTEGKTCGGAVGPNPPLPP